ncbi:MAG TPA: DUF4340 domain-containing protein, partial [Gemmataceae bacterium]|nr:DUF4340 domain-containing protein [Gemmataceae bacterium]
LLVAVLGVFGLMLLLNPSTAENDVYVLPTAHTEEGSPVDTATITAVKIERVRPKAETIAFTRTGDGKNWRMTEPTAWKADDFAVDQLVRQIFDARKEKSDVTSDLKTWELDPPAATITLTDKDGKEWVLNLGKQRPGETTAAVFVTSSDHPKEPMAVSKSQVDQLFKPANDFRSKDLLTEGVTSIRSVRLQPAKGTAIALTKKDETHWRFAEPKDYGPADYNGTGTPPAGTAAKNISSVRELLDAVNNLRLDSDADFVADHVTDWKKYGIGSDSLRITVKHGEDSKTTEDTLIVGKKADAKGTQYYARLANTDTVVKVAAKNVDPIVKVTANPVELRSHDLVEVEESGVDAVDVKNEHGTLRLRHVGSDWKVFDDAGKATKADNDAVQDLVRAVTAHRTIKTFPPRSDEAKLGFDKPTATAVLLWVHGIVPGKKPANDKKAAAKRAETAPRLIGEPAAWLQFVRKPDHVVYVRAKSGKDTTLATVGEDLYDKVEQGRLAYLDRTLPTLPVDADAIKLTLVRDGKTFELTKDDKANTWSLKQPGQAKPVPADTQNVNNIVRELRELRALKLVNEKPSQSALAQYGLGSKTKATLVVRKADKKTEQRVYQFGTEVKDGLYAQESGSDLVFVTEPIVLKTLQSELRDRVLFHFTPDKVKEIKLSGWKPVYKHAVTLDLKREGKDGWKAAKAPFDDFKVDRQKVENFLRDLTDPERPLVERFLDGPAKPEYQLGPDQRTLLVEITVEGEKSPETLALGKLDSAGGSYYGQSSTLPGMVFLVPEVNLGQLTKGLDAFSNKPTR